MPSESESGMRQQPTGGESTFSYWFQQSGFTKKGLATAVNEQARITGQPQISTDGSRVRRWLSGEQPRPPVPDLIAAVLSTRCGRHLTAADLGLAQADPDDLTRYRGPAEILADLTHTTAAQLAHHPVEPPALLDPQARIDIPYDPERLLPALDTWAYAPPHVLPGTAADAQGRRLGATDAARIADYTRVFRTLDNQHGGGSTLHSATGQLAWATRIIRDGRYTEAAGRDLFRELADLAGCVGWMSHDTAQWHAAIRHLTLAVHAARESGDRNLTAHLLQCLARIWGYLGRPDIASDCIALALYGTRNSAHPVLRAGLHSLAARFAALQGDSSEALRNVRHAQEIFGEETPDELPPYVAYLDHAELSSTLGEVLLFLARTSGRPHHANAAVELLNTASAERDPARARSRAFDAVAAARALLVVGDIDGACNAGRQAVSVGRAVDSARVHRRFLDLAREAAPHEASPVVRDLRERLIAVSGTVSPHRPM
ncbi:transcriptional regulator [Streptomyces sp. NPDC058247]|uniref:transcriptional regulator n=1 Tax=Streptomyces sp. NPDC058247 TaxID=3346401 RepID=UPI0036E045B1